jgi:hypothetical protein
MTFEQQWIENDYNPFVLFSTNGKIKSLNTEAQFLLGAVEPKELFELAQTYANINFGFKTTFIELEYGRYKFFGLTVGYKDEDFIGIRLYQTPSFKFHAKKPDGELVNIFNIIDLCISTNSINSNINYIKEYDPAIPEIILDSNNMIKILNKIYLCTKENDEVTTKVFFKVGEHIKFDDKKYSIFSISVFAKNIDKQKLNTIKLFAEENNFYMESTNSITLNIPMILS